MRYDGSGTKHFKVGFLSITLRIPAAHNFASLARASERMHLHDKINFPQAKLDSERSARFVLTRIAQ